MSNRIINIIIVLIIVVSSCNNDRPDGINASPDANPISFPNVKTATAVLSNRQAELTLNGKVTADPDKTVSYVPLVSGVIVKSYFTLGDRVSKGQTMLDIRSAELSALQSELTVARRNLQSAETLYEYRVVSEKELVEARSECEKLEADLALYGENKGNGVFSIVAPISGYVVEKQGNTGSTVSAEGEPLFSIANLNTVWVVANVYAGNLQFVSEGQNVEITSVAYPKEVFKGKINFISQVFDPEDKALKARIVLPNDDLKLKPEMSVIVKLLNETAAEMVTIPSEAVIFDDNRYFVVAGNADFSIREVVPFDHHNGFTYISEGLNAGEEVVTQNQLLIYNELKGK